MSDIPRARQILEEIIDEYDIDFPTKRRLKQVLALLVREKYIRRAPAKRQRINRHLRARIKHLVYNTDLTMHEIANMTGVRSSGRISEVAHGQR